MGIFGVFKVWWIILICFSLYVSLLRGTVCKFFLHCRQIPLSVITNLFLIHFQVTSLPTNGSLSVTKVRTNVKIGTRKNCEMADYLCSSAIQANSFRNDRVDRFYRLTGGGLTNIHILSI